MPDWTVSKRADLVETKARSSPPSTNPAIFAKFPAESEPIDMDRLPAPANSLEKG